MDIERVRRAALVAAVLGGLLAVPAAPAGAAPSIEVTPATALVDTQRVTVTLTGFDRNDFVVLVQCRAGGNEEIEDCQSGSYGELSVDASGAATQRFTIDAVLRVGDGESPESVDCRSAPGACTLVAAHDDQDGGFAAVAPLNFDPDAPLEPPPTLVADPGTGLLDEQEIEVSGGGYQRDSFPFLLLCRAPVVGYEDCAFEPIDFPELEGRRLAGTVRVEATLGIASGDQVDCRAAAGTCVVLAGNPADPEEAGIAPLAFDAAAELAPPASLVADPATDLVHGQEIALRGRRHSSQTFGNPVVQCPAGEIALESCRPVGFVSVGPKGRLTGSATVVAVLRQASPEVDCRQGPGCVLVAGDLFDEDDVGIASLAFDPLAPVPRPPRIAVEPASDLRDGDLVSVSGRGFGGQEEVLQAICASGPVDFESCDFGTLSQVQPGPRGRFTATLDVSTVLDTESGPVDCPEGACEIIAGDFFGGQGAVARAPLAFSAAPPRRYLDRVFEDVEVTRNVHYATAIGADGRPIDLKLDVYRPVGDTVERRPAVVWMHGGGFTFGSKGDMAAYARDSAERGYVGVTIQYRLSPATDGAAIDRAYRDGRAAVRWLRENAATYGIARRAIATGGYSAGAVTAINLAYAGSPSPEDRARVGAAVSLAGTRTIGVPERGEPPVLMFHGDRDTTVPYDQASASCAAILASGVRCRLITFPGAGHGLPYRRHLYAETARFLDRQLLQPEGIVASP